MLGVDTVATIDDLPEARGTSCSCARPRARTPTSCACACRRRPRRVPHRARATAKRATKAAQAERELVALADELGILLAGPNGQGVVSTPAQLCAQIVAPVPAAGPDRDRQPVGQLRLVVRELGRADRRRRQPRGQRRQRGRGRPSPTTSTGTPTTPETAVGLAYVEGIREP